MLLVLCGIQFVELAITNTMISSISPELIIYFNIDKFYVNLLYTVPYIFSFIFTLMIYKYLLYKFPLSYYIHIGTGLFVLSTVFFISIFITTDNFYMILFAVISKGIFGVSFATMSTTLEILLNNQFSITNISMFNGIWTIVLLFDHGGIILSYFCAPYIFNLSSNLFIGVCVGMAALFTCISILILYYYKNVMKEHVSASNIIPSNNIKDTLFMLMIINCTTTGLWRSVLSYLPENMKFDIIEPQTLIAGCLLTGILVAFFLWRFMNSPFHWYIISMLGILIAFFGIIGLLAAPFVDMALEIGLLLFCIGSAILFTTPNIAAVNLYVGDEVRISFIWMLVTIYLSVVTFTLAFNFINILGHGMEIIYGITGIGYIFAGMTIHKLFQYKVKYIPVNDFNKKAMILINLDTQKFVYRRVPVDEVDEIIETTDNTAV